jgi:hypothetical protein
VVTLPGSRGGASESMAAILPALVHIFDVQHMACVFVQMNAQLPLSHLAYAQEVVLAYQL